MTLPGFETAYSLISDCSGCEINLEQKNTSRQKLQTHTGQLVIMHL